MTKPASYTRWPILSFTLNNIDYRLQTADCSIPVVIPDTSDQSYCSLYLYMYMYQYQGTN